MNGNKILAVVQEVGSAEIKYKKYENRQTSPVYTINRKAVKMIKYADGTKDEFIDGTNVKDLPPPVAKEPPAEPNKEGVNKPVIRQQYIYFGARTSLANSYTGGTFNGYWTDLFKSAQDGAVQLNEGSASFYEFFVGNSFPLAGKSHLDIEVQAVLSSKHALYNTAVFLDGSNGDMYFDLFGVNVSGQYMKDINALGNFQVGGEFGVDYGMTNASEVDVFGTSTRTPIYLDRIHSGYGFGAHLAIVSKYFLGARKMFGLELRGGYRALQTHSTSSITFSNSTAYPQNVNLSEGWNGAFVTAGIIFQIGKRSRK